MNRNILQIPIDPGLRRQSENEAKDMGFSSLQEMIRVLLTQMTKKRSSVDFDDLCRKHGISYLGLFGSVARGEERADSDVDLMVKFDKKRKVGLFELARIQDEFEKKLGRKVDLVTKVNKYIKPFTDRDLKTIYGEK